MDTKSIGNKIANLRRKLGMTQLQLAQKLNVSDKTISKWENGQGYPDITAFPILSSLFGVSIDYLMIGERKGIAIAGNLIADVVKDIEIYPKTGMLTYVSNISHSVGGCVPNTAIDLAKIDRTVPISAYGKVGTDENGRYIVTQLLKNGINIEGIKFSDKSPTSFCDVMSMPTGERTFFHQKGANAEFSPSDMDLNTLDCNILHIGYILLLDAFDKPDDTYGTVMAGFLRNVQKRGIKTSIDVVSDSDGDYGHKILPVLKYCNYAIMNEIESCGIFGISPYDSHGALDIDNIKKTMCMMADAGVQDKVIVHTKEISFILDSDTGEITSCPSLIIPKEEIKGSVGAGDAFCAGCLYGIYNNFNDNYTLEFASAAAACSLFEANSVDGMKSKNEILDILEKYRRYEA